MSEPNGVILRMVDVHRTFVMGDVPVQVLKGISLDILEGERLAIVGPSGSGKSTILNLVGALDQPTAGDIYFRGTSLNQMTASQRTAYRRDEVGFVFQFYNLVPNLTAKENIQIATEICRDPVDVDQTLEMVGLADRSDHFPAQLSGGEQQRVAIARAVVKRPSLLLCDEPTGALDFRTGKRVLRLLVDLNEQLKTTLIIITHNAALAQVGRRLIHLRSGKVHDIQANPSPAMPEEVVW